MAGFITYWPKDYVKNLKKAGDTGELSVIFGSHHTKNGKLEWYHFDGNGYMQTGWFTDIDDNRYFLHNVSDGIQGRMVTSWYMDIK